MISSNDFRNGVTLELDGVVFQVIEFQHVKPGKGSAFVRTKLRNLQTGAVVERTFNAGERVPQARVEKREMQYLYQSGAEYTFMDTETFEQIALSSEDIGDGVRFLKENMVCHVVLFKGTSIGVELPNSVDLTVVETDPGFKGDTATGGTKPAKLETGAVIKVPLFIEEGTLITVDTRTGQYVGRA
ncbi:MAG: elongation factor P [Sulfobacillus acidophilus]|uniref:Elongation factor P n=1 Tax=Sulfobacillus acidophilus TaxID=53633 RepID=A0A2T2WPI0_9FIRM|nr:MAG: elongation factor P [Sulfobacillus acidophilus]